MLVSRGDVSCGEEKRGLSLRGEYGKLNRRIFKSASSIDSLQIDISSIGIHLQSAYPVVQDVVVRGVRVLVPMRGAVWTVKPHHVYRAELGVGVFGVSWVLCVAPDTHLAGNRKNLLAGSGRSLN